MNKYIVTYSLKSNCTENKVDKKKNIANMLMTTANLDKNILTSFIHIMLKTKQKKT